jgi:phosphoenolpyruvate carboxylase
MPDNAIKSPSEIQLDNYYNTARKKNLISPEARAYYTKLRHDRNLISHMDEAIQGFAALSEEDRLGISRLMMLERQQLNSHHYADYKAFMETPKEAIKAFMRTGLEQAGDKRGQFLQMLPEIAEQAVVSICLTSHPVVYHSRAGIASESELTQLEELKTPDADTKATLRDNMLRERIDQMRAGRSLTHLRKITVPEETDVDSGNIRELKKYITSFTKNWNAALNELQTEGLLSQKEHDTLHREKFNVELRDWNGGNDADGRPASNSIVTKNTIERGVEDGRYVGTILDMRQNAQVHENAVSALLQRYHRLSRKGYFRTSPEFAEHCEQFMKDVNARGGEWKNPRDTILQQLERDDQARFVKEIIQKDYQLVPERVREETLEFNNRFHALFKEFTHRHAEDIHAAGYDPDKVTYLELGNIKNLETGSVLMRSLMKEVRETIGMSNAKTGKKDPFEINEAGFYQLKDEDSGGFNMFYKRRKLKDGKAVELSAEERVILADTYKRLMLADNAITQYQDQGKGKVADRYQIANFEHERDFYNLMLLMKIGGEIEINKEGKVERAKMGIMPLLETAEDMRRATGQDGKGDGIFQKLMDDTLAQSYFQARGREMGLEKGKGYAEIMVGYSDGARSAGDFASEWQIYKTQRDLHRQFKEKGIQVRFFHGHGKGPDRGGMLEYGIKDYVVPPEVAADAIRDETWQGNVPLEMRMSPAYGNDAVTQTMLGTMTAAIAGRNETLSRTKQDEARIVSYEAAMDYIAAKSEAGYRALVADKANNDAIMGFISGAVPVNKDISSRPVSRDVKAANFDNTRAISVEYGFNMGGVPAHNTGLAEALADFRNDKDAPGVLTKDGRTVHGEEALIELKRNFRFFDGITAKIDKGMQNYTPKVARVFAAQAGEPTQSHMEKIITSLDKLPAELAFIHKAQEQQNAEEGKVAPKDLAKRMELSLGEKETLVPLENMQPAARARRDVALMSGASGESKQLMLIGQTLLASYGGKWKVDPEQDPMKAETVKNAIYTVSEGHSHTGSSPALRDRASPARMTR